MPKLPTVAIIGRPNTGKSTLFNSLLRRRIAITSPLPGTTRDHIARKVETEEMDFFLLDTGGMGGGTADKVFEDDVHKQSLLAVNHADVIVFTVNAREELTKSDHEIIGILRKHRRRHVPVILAATKCDNSKIADEATIELQELRISDNIIPISALNNIGTGDILDAIVTNLKQLQFKKSAPEEAEHLPRIAIVGKPNVGKSSIINALMSDSQRKASPRLVSPVPGTTRDATDTLIRHKEEDFIFVDTAGLRRKARVEEDLESYSILRTIKAIEQSDVVVLVIDASEPISNQDKHIAGLTIESGKGIILLANKWDLLSPEDKERKFEEIEWEFRFCKYAPVLSSSAVTREGLLKLFSVISMVERNRKRRIPTKDLLRWFRDQIVGQPMRSLSTSKHITQAEDPPPTFVVFVKNPKEVRLSQLRYLDNRLRETFGLEGTPVRWITKGPRDRWKLKGE